MSRPGLQPERTDLAWTRTALAAAGCALLLLEVAARRGLTLGTLLPAILTAAAAVALAMLGRRADARPTVRPFPLALVAALLTAACLTAFPIAI